MIRSLTVIAVGVVVIGVSVVAADNAADGLPAGPGHDTFVRVCSSCHAPDLVRSKRLNREGWEEVVQVMIGRGAAGTEAELAEVVEYLTAAFPAKSPAAPAASTENSTR